MEGSEGSKDLESKMHWRRFFGIFRGYVFFGSQSFFLALAEEFLFAGAFVGLFLPLLLDLEVGLESTDYSMLSLSFGATATLLCVHFHF